MCIGMRMRLWLVRRSLLRWNDLRVRLISLNEIGKVFDRITWIFNEADLTSWRICGNPVKVARPITHVTSRGVVSKTSPSGKNVLLQV